MKKYEGDLVAKFGQIYDYEAITGSLDARGCPAGAFPV